MLCQKTNSGKITLGDKDLVQYLVLDGANLPKNTEAATTGVSTPKTSSEKSTLPASSNQLSQKYSQLDSTFLKKFPKTKVGLLYFI